MTADTGLFGIPLLDLHVTYSEPFAVLFVVVTAHTHVAVVEVLVAVVDIMVGRTGSFGDQTKEAFFFFEDDLLALFGLVSREEVLFLRGIDVLVRLGMLLHILDGVTALAGDGFVHLGMVGLGKAFGT
jgi:hypothetical protein